MQIWLRYGPITKEKMNSVSFVSQSNQTQTGCKLYHWIGTVKGYMTLSLAEYSVLMYLAYSHIYWNALVTHITKWLCTTSQADIKDMYWWISQYITPVIYSTIWKANHSISRLMCTSGWVHAGRLCIVLVIKQCMSTHKWNHPMHIKCSFLSVYPSSILVEI